MCKNCLSCKYLIIDLGFDHRDKPRASCNKNHWTLPSDYWSELEIQVVAIAFEGCSDFEKRESFILDTNNMDKSVIEKLKSNEDWELNFFGNELAELKREKGSK